MLEQQLQALVRKQELASEQYTADLKQKEQQIETLTRQLQSVILDNKNIFQEMEILKEKFQEVDPALLEDANQTISSYRIKLHKLYDTRIKQNIKMD